MVSSCFEILKVRLPTTPQFHLPYRRALQPDSIERADGLANPRTPSRNCNLVGPCTMAKSEKKRTCMYHHSIHDALFLESYHIELLILVCLYYPL